MLTHAARATASQLNKPLCGRAREGLWSEQGEHKKTQVLILTLQSTSCWVIQNQHRNRGRVRALYAHAMLRFAYFARRNIEHLLSLHNPVNLVTLWLALHAPWRDATQFASEATVPVLGCARRGIFNIGSIAYSPRAPSRDFKSLRMRV